MQDRCHSRIGIGLLAASQLGHKFFATSSVRGEPSRFLAEIDLEPYHKDDAALRKLSDDEDIELGMVTLREGIPEEPESHFTAITVPRPRRGLITEMNSQLRNAVGASTHYTLDNRALNFRSIVTVASREKRVDLALDGYHYLLWELGLLCPVRYLDGGGFDLSQRNIEGIEELDYIEPQDFEVNVDGYDIRRPIQFPSENAISYAGPDPKIFSVRFDAPVSGRRLAMRGYVYSQKPHIRPSELQGVQIRIRGAGIGRHDRHWLGYPFDEGMKFHQLTGELFGTEGLEDALNIDRESFRESDPHFKALQACLWTFLQTEVFPDFKRRQEQFRKAKVKAAEQERDFRFEVALLDAPNPLLGPAIVSRARGDKTEGPEPVYFEKDKAVIAKSAFDQAIQDASKKKPTGERLRRVLAVLAAYGVFERLREEEVLPLINAIAIAVEE